MTRRFPLIAILVLAVAPQAPADDKPIKLTLQEAEQRLADYWVEVEATVGGKKLPATDLFCWSFVSDADKTSPYCWLRCGEAVLSECSGIGIAKVLDDGTMHITVNGFPGLMKFERHSLIVVTPKEGGSHAWGSSYNRLTRDQVLALVRPKDFTSTRENGHVVRVMKRTSGLYGTEPLPDPKPRPAPKKDHK